MMQLELKYGSEKHERIRQALEDRIDFSDKKMSTYHKTWADAEDRFRGYIPEKTMDQIRKSRRDNGTPEFVTIEVPYTYASAMAALTYWSSVLIARDPVFQYMAADPSRTNHEQAVEALIDYQRRKARMGQVLYGWLLGPAQHGISVVGNYWTKDEHPVAELVEQEVPFAFGKTKKKMQRRMVTSYEGNKIYNVRPQDIIADPRVPLINFQEGEFFGRRVDLNYHELLIGQEQGRYFNIDELKRHKVRVKERAEGGVAMDLPEQNDYEQSFQRNSIKDNYECYELCVWMSPRDWQIGSSSYPEKWVFTLGEKEVIIGAQPLGLEHGRYPYGIIENEVSPFETISRGMMEIGQPLNDLLTWLMNTHLYNVRKSLRDQFIFDPSKVYIKDFESDQPGLMARLKPEAYGTDPRMAAHQFMTQTVTNQHIQDFQGAADVLQRVLGVNDNVMGQLAPGGRKTATEVRASSNFSINRLKTQAEYFAETGWGPLSEMMLANTQQYYDGEMQLRIVGQLPPGAEQGILVTPESIAGGFDFAPVDGTLPVDRYAQANLIKEALVGLVRAPQLLQNFDIVGLFSYMMRLQGIRNIDKYRIQAQAVPDEQFDAQVQAGNTIPIQEAIQNGLAGAA